jgi:PIN domain nuclease of toxin-antitoxin system
MSIAAVLRSEGPCPAGRGRLNETAPADIDAAPAAGLPDSHNDPFDGLLIATALIHGLELFAKDAVLPRYPGLSVVW